MKPFEKYIKVEEERYLKLLENEERIKQAIKYINHYCVVSNVWKEISPLQFIPIGKIEYKSLSKKKVQELLRILSVK